VSPSTEARSARRKLLLLALLFALPMLVAYALYYGGWRPDAIHPHGELVQPARPITDVALVLIDARPIRFSELRGKWTLMTFSAADCLKACERNLHNMRQVIAAQGKEAERVQGLLVVTDSKALDGLRYAMKDYPGTRVIVGPPDAVASLAGQFMFPLQGGHDNQDHVYLVDPLGNFMMRYAADADPTGIRKDLARLLRASRIG
jgi:cytochrome oxidase Cu insertion factor (SCO1/SenC/PrrC family)